MSKEWRPREEYEKTMDLRWKEKRGSWDNPNPSGVDVFGDGSPHELQQKYVHPETGDEDWRSIPIV